MADGVVYGTGWDKSPFSEKKPFGGKATVVAGDNIASSKERYVAMRAIREGRATAEQRLLVEECDRMINGVIEGREE